MKIDYVIAIDGPSGAGKSSVAKELAAKLNLRYIDTGAMYRAAALAAQRRGVDVTDPAALETFLEALEIRQEKSEAGVVTVLDGEDVSAAIRTAAMGMMASSISARPAVRKRLTALQQRMGREGSVVMEGRDIGTVVFPDADFKFFVTASDEERARRRYRELRERGEPVEFETVLEQIRRRDHDDSTRVEAPLRRDPAAVVIDTTTLTLDEVVEEIQRLIEDSERGRNKRT